MTEIPFIPSGEDLPKKEDFDEWANVTLEAKKLFLAQFHKTAKDGMVDKRQIVCAVTFMTHMVGSLISLIGEKNLEKVVRDSFVQGLDFWLEYGTSNMEEPDDKEKKG